VVVNPTYQNLFGMLNVKKKPLDDVKVRQALSYAFPYGDVVKSVMNGYATQSFGTIPKGLAAFDSTAKQYSLDLDKAKALLAEAGVKEGTTLSMTYATGDTSEEQIGELWKANLAKLGITLNLQPMSWEAQWALAKGDPANAQDVFVMYWWPTYVTAYDFLFNLYHGEKSPNYNLGYYNNPKYDALIDKGNETSATDPAAATKMFQDAQKMLIDDAAGVFFYDQENVHIIRSNVKGYIDNPAYSHVVFVYDLTK